LTHTVVFDSASFFFEKTDALNLSRLSLQNGRSWSRRVEGLAT
jgi:hypothetical protein